MLLDVFYFRNCNKQESFSIYRGCSATQHRISNIIYNTKAEYNFDKLNKIYLFIVYRLFATIYIYPDEFMGAVAPDAADFIGKS